MKLALLPKKTRGDAVKVMLTLHYGHGEVAQGPSTPPALCPTWCGAGPRSTAQQFATSSTSSKAELRTGQQGLGGGARPGDAQFAITTVRESVPAVLALLGELVKEPTFPKDEFEKLKDKFAKRCEVGAVARRLEANLQFQRAMPRASAASAICREPVGLMPLA